MIRSEETYRWLPQSDIAVRTKGQGPATAAVSNRCLSICPGGQILCRDDVFRAHVIENRESIVSGGEGIGRFGKVQFGRYDWLLQL